MRSALLAWTSAAVALARPALREEHLGYVRHGVDFLRDRMWDAVHGGFYQGVDAEGRVDRTKSQDWMATYHAARTLLLTSDRLRRQAEIAG